MAKVFEGVRHIHEHKVVHRDFNPTNVFKTAAGDVKVLDFNVSKLVDADHILVPEEGETLRYKYSLFTKRGTPVYSAPEIHTSVRYT